jgi:hypothetical protein
MNEAGSEQQGPGGELASGKEDSCPPVFGKAGDKKNWNAALLILVLLLVGAVGAHSLLTMNRCRARGGACPGSSVSRGWLGGAGRGDVGCPPEAKCSEADRVMSETDGCPLRGDANKPCGGRRDATAPGCCPGAGYRWGRE